MKLFLFSATEVVATLGLCASYVSGSPATIASTRSSAPTVNLGYATYQGITVKDSITNETNTNFLGVRYAAPPTGNNRFRAPSAPLFSQGVQIASNQPPACPATGPGTALLNPFSTTSSSLLVRSQTNEPEDCLFLKYQLSILDSVFVPGTLGVKKSLPVIFWIHGGGYAFGNASQFTGNDILRESGGGVILVVIQYRLGVFGFLPGQKVKDGGILNAGLLDQQFALQWVQQHIDKFGGDPTKVTIWGQSAGGGSVLQHIVANGGNTTPSLFRAAITSSTYLPPQYAYNDRISELLYSEVAAQANCSSVEDSLGCLRTVDVNTLEQVNINITINSFFGTVMFLPVVDGTFITARPSQLLREGKLNTRSLQSVTNTFEGTMFVSQTTADTLTIPQYISQLFPNMKLESVNTAAELYASLGTNLFQMIAIMGETIFICPTYSIMNAFDGSVFKGEFAIPPGVHSEDIDFYFPSTNPGGIPPFNNAIFIKAFSQSFANFAMSLNPNTKFDPTNITPLWKPWNGSTEMLFNQTETNEPDIRAINTSDALLERCAFWQSVSEQTSQ